MKTPCNCSSCIVSDTAGSVASITRESPAIRRLVAFTDPTFSRFRNHRWPAPRSMQRRPFAKVMGLSETLAIPREAIWLSARREGALSSARDHAARPATPSERLVALTPRNRKTRRVSSRRYGKSSAHVFFARCRYARIENILRLTFSGHRHLLTSLYVQNSPHQHGPRRCLLFYTNLATLAPVGAATVFHRGLDYPSTERNCRKAFRAWCRRLERPGRELSALRLMRHRSRPALT